MKLFEYSVLISRNIVIAAKTRDAADRKMDELKNQGVCAIQKTGDDGQIEDIDLNEERTIKSLDWKDEAHELARITQKMKGRPLNE